MLIHEEFRRENLAKLATYLETKIQVNFDMGLFSDTGIYGPDCGTVGCAVGHGPYAGIPKSSYESWMTYSERTLIDHDAQEECWEYCFSASWRDIDNTPQGAARRIRLVLAANTMEDVHANTGGIDYDQLPLRRSGRYPS